MRDNTDEWIANLTRQQLDKLADRLQLVRRPGGFLQPPIAQGAGTATNLLPGLVVTQFAPDSSPPVVPNNRSIPRYIMTADTPLPAGATVNLLVPGLNLAIGETWILRAMILLARGTASAAGFNMGIAGTATAFRRFTSWGPGAAAGALIFKGANSGAAVQGPFATYDISAVGQGVPIWHDEATTPVTAAGTIGLSLINLSGTDDATIKAPSFILAERAS
jgi:hypothetical protein